MNRNDLISEMADELGSVKYAKAALDSLLKQIGDALKKDKAIHLSGFGTFKVSERKARKGRNPQTGEEINIKATKNVRFAASKQLKMDLQ